MFVSVRMVGVSSPTGAFSFDFSPIGFVEGWWSLTVVLFILLVMRWSWSHKLGVCVSFTSFF